MHSDNHGYFYTKSYDDRGDVLTYTNSDGYSLTRTYDSHGNMLTHIDSAGVISTYTYVNDGITFKMTKNGKLILTVYL